MPKPLTKKQRENAINRAAIKAVVGYQIPIMQLRDVSAAIGRSLDAGDDFDAQVRAGRDACERVGTRTDQWEPLPGEVATGMQVGDTFQI